MKHFRDFWCILILLYGVIGLTILRAEEPAVNRAVALLNQGKTDDAISLLRSEADRNPQSVDIYSTLGMAYVNRNDYPAAKSAFERVVFLDPYSVPAHYNLAMIYEREKDTSRALDSWKKVLNVSKDKNLKDLAEKHISQLEGNK